MNAITFYNIGNYDSAIPAFEQCTNLKGSNTETCHRFLGNCHYEKDNFSEAIINYKECIVLRPSGIENYLLMSSALYCKAR